MGDGPDETGNLGTMKATAETESLIFHQFIPDPYNL